MLKAIYISCIFIILTGFLVLYEKKEPAPKLPKIGGIRSDSCFSAFGLYSRSEILRCESNEIIIYVAVENGMAVSIDAQWKPIN